MRPLAIAAVLLSSFAFLLSAALGQGPAAQALDGALAIRSPSGDGGAASLTSKLRTTPTFTLFRDT